jgi:uncharacterized protein with GYD domain
LAPTAPAALAFTRQARSIRRVIAPRLTSLPPQPAPFAAVAAPAARSAPDDALAPRFPGLALRECGPAHRPRHDRRQHTMVTYIGLMNFTDKGLQSVKETTQRAAAAKEVAQRFGVTMKDIYWTAGEYDIVCVIEGKDEQSITAFSLAMAQQGNVRSKSLRAFTSTEMEQVLAKLR